jgi:hypothetical protein
MPEFLKKRHQINKRCNITQLEKRWISGDKTALLMREKKMQFTKATGGSILHSSSQVTTQPKGSGSTEKMGFSEAGASDLQAAIKQQRFSRWHAYKLRVLGVSFFYKHKLTTRELPAFRNRNRLSSSSHGKKLQR